LHAATAAVGSTAAQRVVPLQEDEEERKKLINKGKHSFQEISSKLPVLRVCVILFFLSAKNLPWLDD
jgi:hypothetical protein